MFKKHTFFFIRPALLASPGLTYPTTMRYLLSTLALAILGLCLGMTLVACSSNSTKGGNTSATTDLAHLHWCGGKALVVFRDEGASTTATPASVGAPAAPGNATPTTITDWNIVKARLGFTVYLPTSLPAGACLMSASGTLHDPIFGSSFTIGYLLPTHDALSLSEAPLRTQNPAFQCNTNGSTGTTSTAGASAKAATMQLCTGAHNTTNIVFSARGTTTTLKTFFQDLQPNVNWQPAS